MRRRVSTSTRTGTNYTTHPVPVLHRRQRDSNSASINAVELSIIRLAIKGRWSVGRGMKAGVVAHLTDLLGNSTREIQLAVARILIMAEGQNQRADLQQPPVTDAAAKILKLPDPSPPDPDYLAWKRQRLMEESHRTATAETGADGHTGGIGK